MAKSEKEKIILKKVGRVVSKKNSLTAVVQVDVLKNHPKYKKKYKVSKKYQVHDEQNKLKLGDLAEIVSVKPISKNKSFRVV